MSPKGFQYRPAASKIDKWKTVISKAINDKQLKAGSASKLGGQLSWGGSHMFNRLGRAMLRPIFDQKTKRNGVATDELLRALGWWMEALELELTELKEWAAPSLRPVHLFCDAAGSPPHLGAVIFCDGKCRWTHSEAPPSVLEKFRERKDNQIMGLELLAISLGLSTFEEYLQGRKVIVHSDNTGSEANPPFLVRTQKGMNNTYYA